ncbi:serine/threonine-protein phosphatase 6 regulatory ankyrin repeat subunit B-like isoform X2 [Harmonia axyridis]|uniref:serine/threonine-protein phosphatase 6 regulatory ankyrin repeat subunit B-like isoform X2 n=1 Tax=Harmonia axyridis TaxID=115357 RepID=UPI001E278199|nr:serine/threonine-protein phosphatase 6 regulatory ankyrin repeat subunit B-like isoform X2 [Harmonia axyridis]
MQTFEVGTLKSRSNLLWSNDNICRKRSDWKVPGFYEFYEAFKNIFCFSTNRSDIKDIPKGIDDEVDKDGNTMLHLAVLRNDESMVSCMLIKKADPNKWNYLGNTPVHLAVSHGRIEILRKLVAFGGNLNMNGNKALLPVEMIPLSADKTSMQAILAFGLNMKSKNYKGDTFLLHYLKKYPDRINDIRRLLDNGCDPKATDRAGRNGLFIVTALRSNRQKVELARMLLDYGERADAPMLHRIVMELTPEDIGQESEDILGVFYHNKNRMARRSPYDTLSCSNMVSQSDIYRNIISNPIQYFPVEL